MKYASYACQSVCFLCPLTVVLLEFQSHKFALPHVEISKSAYPTKLLEIVALLFVKTQGITKVIMMDAIHLIVGSA